VKFVFATNRPDHGLEPDLLARLSVIHLAPLSERRADIPHLFTHLLDQSFKAQNLPVEPTRAEIKTVHQVALMFDRFPRQNVRGLITVTDTIASQIAAGVPPKPQSPWASVT
jgi:DNA-binding NtrC family response regulator